MNFENGVDLIDYITENDLLDTAWNANPNFSKKYCQVWFGDIEFYTLQGTSQEIAIVHHVYEKNLMDDNCADIDNYCVDKAYMNWIIPNKYEGMIVYPREGKK
jgi:hypothetical protein